MMTMLRIARTSSIWMAEQRVDDNGCHLSNGSFADAESESRRVGETVVLNTVGCVRELAQRYLNDVSDLDRWARWRNAGGGTSRRQG